MVLGTLEKLGPSPWDWDQDTGDPSPSPGWTALNGGRFQIPGPVIAACSAAEGLLRRTPECVRELDIIDADGAARHWAGVFTFIALNLDHTSL